MKNKNEEFSSVIWLMEKAEKAIARWLSQESYLMSKVPNYGRPIPSREEACAFFNTEQGRDLRESLEIERGCVPLSSLEAFFVDINDRRTEAYKRVARASGYDQVWNNLHNYLNGSGQILSTGEQLAKAIDGADKSLRHYFKFKSSRNEMRTVLGERASSALYWDDVGKVYFISPIVNQEDMEYSDEAGGSILEKTNALKIKDAIEKYRTQGDKK